MEEVEALRARIEAGKAWGASARALLALTALVPAVACDISTLTLGWAKRARLAQVCRC
ncbi:MAG: hypothetical protein JKP92_07695 [Alphaproteobacteria bacterium]|jgi:ATPase subunit of ABC transporter with duplicated ATPase domains|nr:hypothetical protein [Alphaproteobacteria bacterium]